MRKASSPVLNLRPCFVVLSRVLLCGVPLVQAYRLERPLASVTKRRGPAWYAAVEGGEDRRQHHSRQGGSSGGLAVDGVGGVGGCGSGRGGGDVGGGKSSVVGGGAGAGAASVAISASLADSPSINSQAVVGGSGGDGEGGDMHDTNGKDRIFRENSEKKDQSFGWKPAAAATAMGSAADPQEPVDSFLRISGGGDQPTRRRKGAAVTSSADEAFEETCTEGLRTTEDVELSSRSPSPISFRVSGEARARPILPFVQRWPVISTGRWVFYFVLFATKFRLS